VVVESLFSWPGVGRLLVVSVANRDLAIVQCILLLVAATMVISGKDDRFFPLEFQQQLARERLGVEAVVVPGGHLVALGHPDELTTAILTATDGQA